MNAIAEVRFNLVKHLCKDENFDELTFDNIDEVIVKSDGEEFRCECIDSILIKYTTTEDFEQIDIHKQDLSDVYQLCKEIDISKVDVIILNEIRYSVTQYRDLALLKNHITRVVDHEISLDDFFSSLHSIDNEYTLYSRSHYLL